jgi:hypothetical protein
VRGAAFVHALGCVHASRKRRGAHLLLWNRSLSLLLPQLVLQGESVLVGTLQLS